MRLDKGCTAICWGMLALVMVAPTHAAAPARVPRVTYEQHVLPVLTRFGCNAGACHGKSRGQNGFALSLLGFDTDSDHAAITREGRGRRVFPAEPGQSLLLLKAAALVPHGGGRKIDPGSPPFEMLRAWIADGTPRAPADSPKLARISVSPAEKSLGTGATIPLAVTAHYSDGTTLDVTAMAAYQSNESAVVAVDEAGVIKAGTLPGEAAITARYLGSFATCDVSIPLPGDVPASTYESLPRRNFIDGLVWAKLQKLGLTPSARASDSTFQRRAYLDVIGRLPTPDETLAFLASTDANRRATLVDALLDRPEYADHWANKWVDLLRPNPYRVGMKAVMSLDGFVREAFRDNWPYDRFVREIVAAKGSTFTNGASVIFRDRREPEELTTTVTQLFLGIRMECAKCHHHPFESWGQEQFYEFAAYFAKVGRKGIGLSPPISGGEEIVVAGTKGDVKHPLTGKPLEAKPLFGKAPDVADDGGDNDPREALAAWITARENPYFGRVIVNRIWADLMGRGIVDPVDDLRATNPPSNGPLLDALAEDFRDHGCDLKHTIRTIMNSAVYGLASEPNDRNVGDIRNYSRHYRQRMRAESLLDAIVDVTQVPESFDASPAGTRAAAIWTHRSPSLFLDTFGRPDPNQDPPCERTPDTSVVQALHLMNAPALNSKISDDSGRAAALAATDKTPEAIIEELYLLTLCRKPTPEEVSECRTAFDGSATRRLATEDLLWALFNSAEFVFKD
jgi:hypothetical protein